MAKRHETSHRENYAAMSDEEIGARYLEYKDIVATDPDVSKMDPEERRKHEEIKKSEKKYAAVLREMLVKDAQKFNKVKEKIKAQFDKVIAELGVLPDRFSQSESWVNWDIAKQQYFNQHQDEADVRYTIGDPLENEELQRQIGDRHIGWDLFAKTRTLDEHGKVTFSDMVEGKSFLQKLDASHPSYVEIVTLLNKEVKPTNLQLSSLDLARLGKLVRENIEAKSASETAPETGDAGKQIVYQDDARRWKVGVLVEGPTAIKSGQDKGKFRFKVEGSDDYVITTQKPKSFKPIAPATRFKAGGKEYTIQGNYTFGPRGEVEYTLRSNDGEVIHHVDAALLESMGEAERGLETIRAKLRPLEQRVEGLAGIRSKRLIGEFYALQARLEEMGKLMNADKLNNDEMEEIMAMSKALTEFRKQVEADLAALSKDLKKYEQGPARKKQIANEAKTTYNLRLAAADERARQKGEPLPSQSEAGRRALVYEIFTEYESHPDNPWVEEVFQSAAADLGRTLGKSITSDRQGIQRALLEAYSPADLEKQDLLRKTEQDCVEAISAAQARLEEITREEEPLKTEAGTLAKESKQLSKYIAGLEGLINQKELLRGQLSDRKTTLEQNIKDSLAREKDDKLSAQLDAVSKEKVQTEEYLAGLDIKTGKVQKQNVDLTTRKGELEQQLKESREREKNVGADYKSLQPRIDTLRNQITVDEQEIQALSSKTDKTSKNKVVLLTTSIGLKRQQLQELEKKLAGLQSSPDVNDVLVAKANQELDLQEKLRDELDRVNAKIATNEAAIAEAQQDRTTRKQRFDELVQQETQLNQELAQHRQANPGMPTTAEDVVALRKELTQVTRQLTTLENTITAAKADQATRQERYNQVLLREGKLHQQITTLQQERSVKETELQTDTSQLQNIRQEIVTHERVMEEKMKNYLADAAWKKIDSYERDLRVDAPAFNFAEEKKSLVDEVGKTRQLIEALKNPVLKNELASELGGIEREVATAEQGTTDESEFLDQWKRLSRLKIRLVEAGGEKARGEVKARAVEIPSYVLEELLKGHGPELKRVMEELYLSKINYVTQKVREGKKEKEQTFISATPAVTEALKNIFSSDTPPSGEMLAQLRQLGIKDWSRFKELWDTHYAKQVGMILHERIQDTIDTALVRAKEQRIHEEEQARAGFMNRLKGFFKPKASVYRNNETDKEHKERIRREREEMTQRLMTGEYLDPRNPLSELSGNAQEKLVQLLAHATQQVGVEVKLAQAKDDAERKQIVAEQGLALEGYQIEGNKLVTKRTKPGEKLFGVAKAAAETGTLLREFTPEDLQQAEDEMQGLLKNTKTLMNQLRLYQDGQSLVFSDEQSAELARNLKQLEFIVRGNEEAPRNLVAALENNSVLATQARRLLADKEHLGGLEKTQWNPFTERPLLVGESRTREDFQRVAAALERHEEQYRKLIRSDINAELGRQHSKLAFVFGLGVAVMGSMYAGPKIADALGPSLYVPNIEIVRQRDQAEAAKRKREKQYSVRGTEASRVVINDEAEVGNLAEKTMTTTKAEWSLPKTEAFEKAAKTVSGLQAVEVTSRRHTIQDWVEGIKDDKERAAAVKGVYFLAGSVEQGSDQSKAQLKELMEKTGDKDQEAAVIKTLVELGKKVTRKTPEVKIPEDKRTGVDMVAELKPLVEKYGSKEAYEKAHKGADAYMTWAPDVLKARLKVGPLYQAGENKLDVESRLKAYMYDTAMMLARLRAESNGYPAEINIDKKTGKVNAVGMPQLAPSTVTEFCPGQPIDNIEVQLTCAYAENTSKSNLHNGSAVDTLISYVSSNSRLANYEKAAGTKDPEKIIQWLAKGGKFADRDPNTLTDDEKKQKESMQRIPPYVRKNLVTMQGLLANHAWFNELLQKDEFKPLWQKELKGKLPEFGLEGAPEQVATNTPEVAKPARVATPEKSTPPKPALPKPPSVETKPDNGEKTEPPAAEPLPEVPPTTTASVQPAEQITEPVEQATNEQPPVNELAQRIESIKSLKKVVDTTSSVNVATYELVQRAYSKLLAGTVDQNLVKELEKLAATNPEEARTRLKELGQQA
jgi:hypothetical protein